jgi:hypothetical protein
MTDKLTYGATRAKLIANGYAPVSASAQQGHRVADEPAAIVLIPRHSDVRGMDSRTVGALFVCVEDTKARAEIVKILASHGLGKSPVRVDSAGSLAYLFAITSYEEPYSQRSEPFVGETEAAVLLDTFTRENAAGIPESYIMRLDGTWENGSPLTVRRGALPEINISEIFHEIGKVLDKHTPTYEAPKLKPSKQQHYARPEMLPYSDSGSVSPGTHSNPFDNRSQL